MEAVATIIRVIIGLAFVAYGIINIVIGFAGGGGCLLHLINAVVAPLVTGLTVLLFPQIVDEVMAMDDSGGLVLALLIMFFIAPIAASLLSRERIAGLLNGLGFIFVGMLLSGVVPGVIVLGGVGILVKIISVVALPAILIMFFFA